MAKDYSKLSKEELVEKVKELEKDKKYGLVWEEKQEDVVRQCQKELPVLIEVKNKEIITNKDEPTNILIEGDNYHALSVLNYTHAGKIDVIYIDPPYNTGNMDFKYNDKYIDSNDHYRHSKWLSFMKKRLELTKYLLTKNGAIFISIDDNELAQLKLLCDKIFSSDNFITNICVKMSHLSGVKMSHLDKKLPKLKEYVLMYARNKQQLTISPIYERVAWDKAFSRYKSFIIVDEKEPNNFEKWKVIPLNKALIDAKIDLNDNTEIDKFYYKNAKRIFRTARNRSEQFQILPNDNKFRLIESKTGLKKLTYKKEEVLFADLKLKELIEGEGLSAVEPLGDLWTDIGINNLHNEGGVAFRNGKKPIKLIKRIIKMYSKQNAQVLDFMAGSGTTGQAVIELNKADGGNRKFILCTNNENNIAEEICYKRIKNVIKGYDNIISLGSNLRYFKTDFVPKTKISDDTKYELVNRSTEMICLREDTFDKVLDKKYIKIFESKKQYTAMLFHLDQFEQFKKELQNLKKRIHIYVFSLTNDTYDDDFSDLKQKHDLCPIPESILEVYRKIFKE